MPGQNAGLAEMAPPQSRADTPSPSRRLVTRFCHDCRTPLAVIAEFASIVREDIGQQADSDTLEFLTSIGDRAFELEGLIADFTLVHRLGSVQPMPADEACDLGALLAGLAANLTAMADRAGRQLVMPDCPPGILVPARRDDLGRAVAVLIENMCRLPRAGGQIRIEVEPVQIPGEVRISVECPSREGAASGGKWMEPPEERLSFRHHVAAAVMRHYGGRLEARDGIEQRCCRLVMPAIAGTPES